MLSLPVAVSVRTAGRLRNRAPAKCGRQAFVKNSRASWHVMTSNFLLRVLNAENQSNGAPPAVLYSSACVPVPNSAGPFHCTVLQTNHTYLPTVWAFHLRGFHSRYGLYKNNRSIRLHKLFFTIHFWQHNGSSWLLWFTLSKRRPQHLHIKITPWKIFILLLAAAINQLHMHSWADWSIK